MSKLVYNCALILLVCVIGPWLVQMTLSAVGETLGTALSSAGSAIKVAVLLFGLSLFAHFLPVIGRPVAVLLTTFAIIMGLVAGIILLMTGGSHSSAGSAGSTFQGSDLRGAR